MKLNLNTGGTLTKINNAYEQKNTAIENQINELKLKIKFLEREQRKIRKEKNIKLTEAKFKAAKKATGFVNVSVGNNFYFYNACVKLGNRELRGNFTISIVAETKTQYKLQIKGLDASCVIISSYYNQNDDYINDIYNIRSNKTSFIKFLYKYGGDYKENSSLENIIEEHDRKFDF